MCVHESRLRHRICHPPPPTSFRVGSSTDHRPTIFNCFFFVCWFVLFQGGFARVHELTDLTTGHVYAGKIIPKSRITKPHHREKV